MCGIYLHFPFCKKKCIYCAFYSIGNFQLYESYLNALLKEIELRRDYLGEGTIQTLYFGGGTPTLLSLVDVEKILNCISKYYTFESNFEFTFEGNPEQLSKEYLVGLKNLGVNRLSIGVQSFDDEVLHLLGRTHNANQACEAIENALQVGLENVSVDLIYGIYARSISLWRKELQNIAQFQVPHFSAYSLTVEENSLLERKIHQNRYPQLDENQSIEELGVLIDFAEQQGYEHYEVSNFAQKGFRSRHNSHYWDGTPYIGLGPSAHSFNGLTRQWNCASVKEYVQRLAAEEVFFETETLSRGERYNEYVLLHLRTARGISLRDVAETFGEVYKEYLLRELLKIDPIYYIRDAETIRISRQGIPLTDAITAELFVTDSIEDK